MVVHPRRGNGASRKGDGCGSRIEQARSRELKRWWRSGAFTNASGSLRATFRPHGDVTDRDVANLLRAIAARVRRWQGGFVGTWVED
jgi:hypothetical protein